MFNHVNNTKGKSQLYKQTVLTWRYKMNSFVFKFFFVFPIHKPHKYVHILPHLSVYASTLKTLASVWWVSPGTCNQEGILNKKKILPFIVEYSEVCKLNHSPILARFLLC